MGGEKVGRVEEEVVGQEGEVLAVRWEAGSCFGCGAGVHVGEQARGGGRVEGVGVDY